MCLNARIFSSEENLGIARFKPRAFLILDDLGVQIHTLPVLRMCAPDGATNIKKTVFLDPDLGGDG